MPAQSNFSKLVILSVSDSAPDTDRDLLDNIFPNEMIKKNELDHIAYRAVLKWEINLSLHDVMKFCDLAVQKIRFIITDSRK